MKARYLWYVLGVALISWGAQGLLLHVSTRQLLHAGRLFAVSLAGHDGVLAPLSILVGAATARWMPRVVRTPLRVGLGFSVVLVVLALPSITSEHRLRNPSVLPLDYERNLALLLGLVALGVVISAGVRLARERGRTREHPPPA